MNPIEQSLNENKLKLIIEKMGHLHHIRDINALLDSILYETRKITNADSGSIFLVDNDKLRFSYVQNDTLFKNDLLCNKYIYSNQEIEINSSSLAGFVAQKGEPLQIEDAYNIDDSLPFQFNVYFDEISSYKTKSIFVAPLITSEREVVGILELINAKDNEGNVISFSEEHKLFVMQFTNQAAVAIERALMLQNIVLRMIQIAELRDPEETQGHVNRVGAISIELYQKWAEKHHVPKNEVNRYKDILRIASILHDVGKVGIPDHILKKNGKLTPEEYHEMKRHTIYGARLFSEKKNDWEKLALEISLNHHEKWDGSGYPGKIEDFSLEEYEFGTGKKGNEIPLSARIVALADVFDALINKRAYKDPWEEDKVLYHLKSESGKHFDPELVDIFFEIYSVVKAIQNKWQQ